MFKLKAYTNYINGVVGSDFKLTLWEKIKIMFSKKLTVAFVSANKSVYTKGNVDNMYEAIMGLTQFCHSYCMNCKETEEKGDVIFRCGECPFVNKETHICSVKVFVNEHGTEEQKQRAFCMSR